MQRTEMTNDRFLSNWASQARKGVLELVVMRALSNGDSYGYALAEELKETCGLSITDGTLYTIFARLKKEGLVGSHLQEMETGPARKYYRLTDAGRRVLKLMDGAWEDTVATVKKARDVEPPS